MGKQPGSAPGDAPDHLGSILSARKTHRPSRPETGATDDFRWGFFWENFGEFSGLSDDVVFFFEFFLIFGEY
jgi:hypothetical protein